jgi:hypothetical protein
MLPKYILRIAILVKKMSKRKIKYIVIFVDQEHVINVFIKQENLLLFNTPRIKIIIKRLNQANVVKFAIENF